MGARGGHSGSVQESSGLLIWDLGGLAVQV